MREQIHIPLEEGLEKGFEEAFRLAKLFEERKEIADFYVQNGVDSEIARRYTLGASFKLEDVRESFSELVREGYDPNAAAILLSDSMFRKEQTSQSPSGELRLGRYISHGAIDRMYKARLAKGQKPIDAAKAVAIEIGDQSCIMHYNSIGSSSLEKRLGRYNFGKRGE